MLNGKTVTLLKKIATTSSTQEIQAKLENLSTNKRNENKPIKKQEDDKHILIRITHTHHSKPKKAI